ncbi:MAG: glycosyltransferase family 2 protein [Ruminococcaceae bacterium]|nr:glycosyltransferase family 2 protein [Oscillospiraceae bacterium]
MDDHKKLVSVIVPVYNEVLMIDEIYDRISTVCSNLQNYRYEIVFFDDGSTDGTRDALITLCAEHDEVKSVFYARNFGYLKSTFYCMQQAKGDCAILMHADLQNPPECIPEFIEKWEKGAQVVLGVKNKSRENRFMYFLRTVFYFLMIRFFGVKITPHATEFELFDKSFIAILQKIKVNNPFLRGIVNEYASKIDYVYYTQDARRKGKSKFNISKYYDFAMCGITQYSRVLPRRCITVSLIALIVQIFEFFLVVVPSFGKLPLIELTDSVIIRCVFVALCLLSIVVCVLFEYIITMQNNMVEKPLIVEEQRIRY